MQGLDERSAGTGDEQGMEFDSEPDGVDDGDYADYTQDATNSSESEVSLDARYVVSIDWHIFLGKKYHAAFNRWFTKIALNFGGMRT